MAVYISSYCNKRHSCMYAVWSVWISAKTFPDNQDAWEQSNYVICFLYVSSTACFKLRWTVSALLSLSNVHGKVFWYSSVYCFTIVPGYSSRLMCLHKGHQWVFSESCQYALSLLLPPLLVWFKLSSSAKQGWWVLHLLLNLPVGNYHQFTTMENGALEKIISSE